MPSRTHRTRDARSSAAVFLIFHSTGVGRAVWSLGLGVPGAAALSSDEELAAVWRILRRNGITGPKFTVLSVPVVARAWLDQILAGDPLGDHAPAAFTGSAGTPGPQVFTRSTLSMINNTIVGRSGDFRPVVCGSSGSMMEKSP